MDLPYERGMEAKGTMNYGINPNTGKPWDAVTDYWWEKPRTSKLSLKMYGLRNPHQSHHRILFFPESQGVLVCWVNTQADSGVKKYTNNKEYKTFDEARHLWGCMKHPNQKWIRDDSVPPRMVHPGHPDSGWGTPTRQTTNYALEA